MSGGKLQVRCRYIAQAGWGALGQSFKTWPHARTLAWCARKRAQALRKLQHTQTYCAATEQRDTIIEAT